MQELMTSVGNSNRLILLLVWAINIVHVLARDEIRSLHILHSNDNESSLQDFNTGEEKVVHYSSLTTALMKHYGDLRNRNKVQSIHVTGGGIFLSSPFYNAAAQVPSLGANGLGDMGIFNALDINANGIGNQELNGGIDEFALLLATAEYPFLSANLDFGRVNTAENVKIDIEMDAMECAEGAGKIAKSCYIDFNDFKVGLIGKSSANFFSQTNDPDTRLPGLDFVGGRDRTTNLPRLSMVSLILEQVDKLEAKGVDIIVLLDQDVDYLSDANASKDLRGIDVIVCAECWGIMASKYESGPFNLLRKGDEIESSYPTIQGDMNGNFIIVVGAPRRWEYIGNCIVSFDEFGHVINYDKDSGPIATTENVVELIESYTGSSIRRNNEVVGILKQLQKTPLMTSGLRKIGTTDHVLDFTEMYDRETNIGRLVADAYLWKGDALLSQSSKRYDVDFSFKNAGGIRASIPGPNIIRLILQQALAYNNVLVVKRLTVGQVLATFENAVSQIPEASARFPQVAGMELEYDPSKEGLSNFETLDKTSRIVRLKIGDTEIVEKREVVAYRNDKFILATNDFVANGGDGYAAIAVAETILDSGYEEQTFVEEYLDIIPRRRVQIVDPPKKPRIIKSLNWSEDL